MAEVVYNPIIDDLRGALSKRGLVSRQKIFRDSTGRILRYGKQEGYYIVNPRNFKRHPMKGEELAHHNRWRDACLQTKQELADPELRAKWETRFNAQLPNIKGTSADPQAPIDKTSGKRKRYAQLYPFTRTMIYLSLKNNETH